MASATLQTNDNNDLFLPDGRNLVVLTGSTACAQNIRQKTLMRSTEDMYNQRNGVQYFETVFSPQPNPDLARKSLIDNIMAVPDVIEVLSLDLSINGDELDYVALVSTPYGQLTIRSNA